MHGAIQPKNQYKKEHVLCALDWRKRRFQYHETIGKIVRLVVVGFVCTRGWNLVHTAQDEMFAAIEGTAFHTRIILERMAEHGVPVDRVINAGGIPQNNPVLNQVYADVLKKPILVPSGVPTSLGSGIFASLAAGIYPTVEAAQDALCLKHRVFEPQPIPMEVYDELYEMYRRVYFALGQKSASAGHLGDVLPELRGIAARANALSQADTVKLWSVALFMMTSSAAAYGAVFC